MTNSKSNSKIFKAVTAGALVASSFSSVAAPISAANFTDIENNYHKNDILQLLDRGIINGFPDGTFQPEKSVTRGQAAKIIAGILKLETKNVENPNFTDVDPNHEFYPYIAALAKAGVINGYEDNTFRQDVTITRGQMAKMIALGFKLTASDLHPFTDVPANSIYADYISALYTHDVTTGTTETTFSPRNNVTRGQLSSFVIRAEQAISAEKTITGKITAVTPTSITIKGNDYTFAHSTILEDAQSRSALLNSSITFNTKGNQIQSIDQLELANSTTAFNGHGIKIDTLVASENLETLTAVEANQVSIQNLTAFASLKALAKQETVALTVRDSKITELHASTYLDLTNINSTIEIVNALKSTAVNLTGKFNSVLIAKNSTITGTAKINSLVIAPADNLNISITSTLEIDSVKIGEATKTLQEAVQAYNLKIITDEANSNNTPPGESNTGGANSGNTNTEQPNTGDSNSSNPNTGGSNTNNPEPEKPGTGESNTNNPEPEKPGTGESNTNNPEPEKPGTGESNTNNPEPEKPGTGESNTNDPATPTGKVDISNDTSIDFSTNEITVGEQTFELSTEQTNTIAAYLEDITALTVIENDAGQTVIENISLRATDTFDGSQLTAVQNITLSGAVSDVQNVVAEQLNITSRASSLHFDNVAANIAATGTFTEITGAAGETLTVSSTESHVDLRDVTSQHIVIKEVPIKPLAMRSAFASLTPFAAAAVNTAPTTMTISFADGDYSGQSLTVERKDTLIDLRGNVFSKITVQNDGVDLQAYDVSAINVAVANNVTNLRLNANASTLTLNLQQPIAISGNTKTIANLAITTTAANTDGWVDLIGVTVNTATLNGTAIQSTHDIFKKYTSDTFAASLVREKFGYYKIEAAVADDEKLKYVLLKESDPVNTTAIPANAVEYTDTAFIPYADTPKIVVYKEKNNAFAGYTIATMPNHGPITATNGIDTANNAITFTTRFSNAVTPQQALQYVFVFKPSANPYINTNLAGPWTKVDGLNTYRIKSDLLDLSGKTLIVTNEFVSGLDITVGEDTALYINALKVVASYAAPDKLNNPKMIYELLERLATTTAVPFDSSFLSKYVEALNASPDSYNTKEQLEALLSDIQAENAYDPSYIKTAEDLYLTGAISSQFNYSTEGIAKATLSDNGELLLIGEAAGNTTIKVQDENGNATLINVTVGANKAITNFDIIEENVTNIEFLRGESDFRIYTKGAQKILLPTDLKNTLAITKDGDVLKRHVIALNGSQYVFGSETITPLIEPIQTFGFDDVSAISDWEATLVGAWTTVDGKLAIYPVYNGSETIFVGDGKNRTAVHVTVGTSISADIAKSTNALSIANDLQLQSAKTIELAPSTAKVHLYNDGTTLRAFAEDAAIASYEITDQASNRTLVNVTATNTNGVVKVDQFDIVKADLTLDAGVTVQNISNPIVRVVNNTLFATATGTTTVTLSNGVQYNVVIEYANNQYTMTATAVQNLIINAADLQMTNITDVATANTTVTTHKIDNNSKLVVAMNTDTTATLTLTSSNNEKTVIHVTKTGNSYTFTKDMSTLPKEDLGLDTLTDVFGSAVDVLPARAKVTADGNNVNIYNFEVGNRTFRVTDGTNSTAVNVVVTANGNGFTSTPEVVKHEIKDVTLATNATIASPAAHLKDGILYATGLGLVQNEATVSVPLDNGANYVIKIKLDPDTGLYSFDETATVTFNKTIHKSELGLDTLTSAPAPANSNTDSVVVGENVVVSVTDDTETRIQVNGTDGTDTNAKAFIYVKRDDADPTNPLVFDVEKKTDAIDLKSYGFNSAPLAIWSHDGIARAHIANDFTVDFYALALGKARYDLIANDKKLLVNVDVSGANKRDITATVVKKDLAQEGTIISGDGVRLSADRKTIYATKENVKTVVRLADNTIIEYTVTVDTNGHYELVENILPAASTKTITADDLALTGNITATGLDTNLATKLEFEDTITLSGKTAGETSLIITDESNKSVIVNVAIDAAGVITISPIIKTDTASTAQLIHTEDQSVVRIDGTDIYAIGEGTAELFVNGSIQQVTVKKENGKYSISAPQEISTAVYTAENLGFDATADLTIETGNDQEKGYDQEKFYVANFDGKIIAYSKLTGTTEGSTEVKITATGTTLSTLVRLNDKGTTFEHKIAKTPHTFTSNPTVQDSSIARYKDGQIYTFKTGHTYVTVDGRMQALDVTRDAEDYLTATVRPLEKTGTSFAPLASTDSNIIEISADKTTLYAKGFGTTQVKDGDKVYNVEVKKDENNKVTMIATEVSSKFVSIADAGLDKMTNATLLYGTPNALSFDRDPNTGITIYSNGSVKSETFSVKVTNGTYHAVINVTVNDAGVISEANVAKTTIENVAIAANETHQTTNARAVWDGNQITIYALEQGNAAFAFANGLVNAQVAKSGNTLVPAGQLLQHTFDGALNTVSNGSIVKLFNDDKSIYPIGEDTALARTADKLYTINIAKANEQYTLNVSQGVPMTTLDLTAAGGTFAIDESTLVGVKAIQDEDAADNKLIIYKDGTGVSDIAITSAGAKTIYHVTATNSEVKAPVVAKTTLTGQMAGATLLEGSSVRQQDNDLYYLATGNAILKADDNRLINVDVKRDSTTQYFTSTQTFASATLKEAPASAGANYKLVGQTAYALNGVGEATFLTANYRTTLTTTKNGAAYELTADERLARQFDFAPLGLSSTIDSFTPQNIAVVEERDGKLVIYAGTEDGTTTIEVKDNNGKTVKFNVARANNGATFTVTPLVAIESVKFADMGLSNTTDAPITATVYDPSIATVIETETGLNISAINQGVTSITLKQDDKIVGLINIVVDANKNVTSTPVQMTANGTLLHSTMTVDPRVTTDKGTFITSVGTSLFETTPGNAVLMRVTQNATTGFYTVETTEHALSTLELADLGLNTISSVALTGSSVGTFTAANKEKLYVYGTNTGTTDIVVTEKVSATESKHTLIVANNNSGLVTTVAKQELADVDKLSTSWSTNLVEIRDHVIYATQSGKGVAEATLNGHKVLMNISVTRNTNQTFAITHNVVAQNLAGAGTVIDGESVAISGNRAYAQKVGTSTIKVGTDIYEITVTQTGEGLFEMTMSEPLEQVTLTAAELGMTKINGYEIKATSGAGVVTTEIIGQNSESIIIFAKNIGHAEITVEGDTGNTIVQADVVSTVDGLALTTNIAKTNLVAANTITDTTNTFRGYADELYALKPGHVVTHVNGQLYNLNATLTDGILEVSANRIEKDMGAEPVVADTDTVVTEEGNKLVAIGFGETFVTVGSDKYRVQVNTDGTIQTELLVAETIDVGAALTSIKPNIVSTIVRVKETNGTEITFEPVAIGKEFIELSDDDGTILVEVEVTPGANDSKIVSAKLISNSYGAGVIGFYPTGLGETPANTFKSEQGVLKIGTDGMITFYPGKTGSSHVLVTGNNKQAIYDLNVVSGTDYKFQPLTLTVPYSEFEAYPTVLDKSGNATAKQGNGGMEVTFVDTEETVFVLQGESGYKTLLVQVSKQQDANKYNVTKSVIGDPLHTNGAVSSITGQLRTAVNTETNETVIYADKNTDPSAATYTANNQLYKVTVGTDYALTEQAIKTPAGEFSSVEHLEKEDVATIVDGQWQALKEGTGIYRTDTNEYVQVTVDLENEISPITVTDLQSLQTSATNTVVLMENYTDLYVDGTTIYGSFTGNFVAKVDGILHKGSISSDPLANTLTAIKADLLTELGWTGYETSNYDDANIVKVVGNELFATGKGTQNITFTSATGLSRTLAVTVDDQYNLSVVAEPNIITYTSRTVSENMGEYTFTFSFNLETAGLDLTKVKGTDTQVTTNKQIIMTKTAGSTMESEFRIVLPEFGEDNEAQYFIISSTNDDTFTVKSKDANSTLQFNKVEPN